MGPLLTDVAAGYDHINAAIGTVLMREYIDWVSLVTPAEHMSLPTLKDCQDGMAAINLARHILDLIRNDKEYEWDRTISEARNRLDWKTMRDKSINPYNPRWEDINVERAYCSLCGPYCPLLYNKSKE